MRHIRQYQDPETNKANKDPKIEPYRKTQRTYRNIMKNIMQYQDRQTNKANKDPKVEPYRKTQRIHKRSIQAYKVVAGS